MTKTQRGLSLGAIAALILTGILSFGIRKTIHLVINGQSQTLTTRALTTGWLLREMRIPIGEGDDLNPELNAWLKDGDTVTIKRAARIRIQDRKQVFNLISTEKNPAKLLEMAGVELSPHDQLLYNGLAIDTDQRLSRASSYGLQILRAHEIIVETADHKETFQTATTTLGQALWQAGIRIHQSDLVTPGLENLITKSIKITYQPSQELRIRTKDEVIHERTTKANIGSALAQAGIPLEGLDYSIPPAEAALPEQGNIRVVHVEERIDLETEPLPFDTEYQPVSDLELDKETVVQAGSFGIRARRIRVRLEDGKEVARHTEAEYTAQEPRPRILGYGTKIVPKTVQTSSGQIRYWRAVNMYAVSYNPTSAGGNITASGLPLQKGVAAVDPAIIPLGTRLFIPGYGEAVAADTGGGVKGRIIDLGYSDRDYVSWHQWVTVYFLWPPPENVAWVIP
jgi:uncharacterized protein YabE (DUF348 family)